MRILAAKSRQLGDTVLWTRALSAITELFPKAKVDLAFPAAYEKLFENDPRFENKYLLQGKLGENRPILQSLRYQDYEWVLNFHASAGSRRFFRQIPSRNKIFHHHSRKPKRFGSDIEVPQLGVPTSALERDLNVVRGLGWSGATPKTKIFPTKLSVHHSKRMATEAKIDPSLPLIVLGVGASRLSKTWPADRYLKLIELLRAQHYQVGIIYETKGSIPSLLASKAEGKVCWLPTPDLEVLMGVLSHASVYVGPDSGVKHLAIALGISTVTLFGPESIGEWHGYELDRNRVIQIPVACRFKNPEPVKFSWCAEAVCPLASHACMTLIRPEKVLDEVMQLI